MEVPAPPPIVQDICSRQLLDLQEAGDVSRRPASSDSAAGSAREAWRPAFTADYPYGAKPSCDAEDASGAPAEGAGGGLCLGTRSASAGAGPGVRTEDNPASRAPIHRVPQPATQQQPREDQPAGGQSRSPGAVRLRKASGKRSHSPSRSPCSPRRERSRGRARRPRRAATAPATATRPRAVRAPAAKTAGADRLELEIRVLRHARAQNLPALLPPFLRSLSTEQLRSTVVFVMEEWSRREATTP